MRCLFLLSCFLFIANATAKPIDADLFPSRVEIDHNFQGSNLLMFGVRNDVGRIVVALRGPKSTYIVRKKEKVAGIWVNRQTVTFTDVDSSFSIGSNANLSEIRNNSLLRSLHLELNGLELNAQYSGQLSAKELDGFQNALREYKITQGLYNSSVLPIHFWGETLFRTMLLFPKNIERGWYIAELYLFNNGLVSAMQTTPIEVRKIGLEAALFDFAHNYRVLYGLFSVTFAIMSGWVASRLFRRVH